ncbi:MAG: phosphate starvation-inducible protein PhoH [Actinomycetota bacterium]
MRNGAPRRPIALVDPGIGPLPHLGDPRIREMVEPIDIYELASTDLNPHGGLIIGAHVDQELLHRERAMIRNFLDEGKVIAFSGQLLHPWLPGAGPFVPRKIRSYHDYRVRVVSPHPIFEGVREDDLTFRRGVAGFFARGHNPPPEGAEVLAELPGGEPVVYVDRSSTGGVILVHAGHDLLTYGLESVYGDDAPATSASRIGPQLLAWMLAEKPGA